MNTKMDKSSKLLLWVLSLSVVVTIAVSTYNFLIVKNYDFIIEAECSPETENCFYRDCEEEECPPNGLSSYKSYIISAADFDKCQEDSCSRECRSGTLSCQEIICGESSDDFCSSDIEVDQAQTGDEDVDASSTDNTE